MLGHGGAGKVPVFGILKRGGKVYAKLIPDARTETLMPIMNPMILPDSIVFMSASSTRNASPTVRTI